MITLSIILPFLLTAPYQLSFDIVLKLSSGCRSIVIMHLIPRFGTNHILDASNMHMSQPLMPKMHTILTNPGHVHNVIVFRAGHLDKVQSIP